MSDASAPQSHALKACAALLLLAAAEVAAQTNRVTISAPDAVLIAGQTVQLQVLVRDANGAVVTNPQVTWGSNNPTLIRVDERGNATATGIGTCGVFAQSAGIRTNIQLQCAPLRIDLRPGEKEMMVGEQLQFDAQALDINGQPIPNVNFNWQVTGANGGQINAARIEGNGLFTAVGTGVITVRARLNLGGGAGRIEWIWDEATVRIQPQNVYRVRRLIGTDDVRHSFILRSTQGTAVNEYGQAAFVGSLDGLTTALLSYDRGRVSLVTQSGVPFMGGIAGGLGSIALNSRGEILAQSGGNLLLYTSEGPQYLLLSGQNFGTIQNIRPDGNPPRWSLNDSGQVVFRAGFQVSGSTRGYTGLFRLANRRLELLASNESALPGFPALTYSFDQYGIDNQGSVYFLTNSSSGSAVFRVQTGDPQPLLSRESFPGLTVNYIADLAVSKEDGVAVRVDLRDRPSRLVRLRGAQRTEFAGGGVGQIYQASDSTGVLFHYCNNGCGVAQWKDGAVKHLLLQGRLAPNGQPITGISAASLSAAGVLTAHVATPESQFVLMQGTTSPSLLLQAGDRIDVDASPEFGSLVRGAANGPLYLRMGAFQGNLFEYDNGALIPRLLSGDRLPDGATFSGGLFSTVTGDIYFNVGNSVYRFRNGATEVVIPQGMRLADGTVVNGAGVRAANSRGALVISAGIAAPGGPNSQVHYVVDSGRFTEIVRNGGRLPDGRTITQVNDVHLDDDGRVAFRPQLDGQNQNAYFLWNSGRIETLFAEGRQVLGGVPVTSMSFWGGRGPFFWGYGFSAGSNDAGIFGYTGDGWQPALHTNYRMPDGSIGNYNFGAWDVNGRMEIAFVTQSGPPLSLNVRTVDGELRQVVSMLAPMADGTYLRQISQIDFRDDGRIFFTAFDSSGRFSVYVAEPL
jgi:hypothetical protein